jgi:Mg2+ and Co2+ transporter CorA
MGVMAGIMLRIRSFLFLGTSFLLLTLVTIIWHASVDLHQTWLIWVSGIALGLAIILMFAFFEKNRTELLTTVEHLKDWQG